MAAHILTMPHPIHELLWYNSFGGAGAWTDDDCNRDHRARELYAAQKARRAALDVTRRALVRLARRVSGARKAYRKAAVPGGNGTEHLHLQQQQLQLLEASHSAMNLEYWYGPEGVFESRNILHIPMPRRRR